MQRKISPLVVLFFMLAAPFSYGAGLNSLVDEAKENNPELKALKNLIMASEARVKVESSLDDPELMIEFMDADSPYAPNDAMEKRYLLKQTIPFPGKRSLKKQIALKEVLMAKEEFKEKELEIIAALKQLWFDYAAAEQTIKITEEVKKILSDMSYLAEVRYSQGMAATGDLIKTQIELTLLDGELITLSGEKDIITAKINSILNRDVNTPLGEPDDINALTGIKESDLIIRALQESPSIKKLEYEVAAQTEEVTLKGRDYYPNFTIGVAAIERDAADDTWDVIFGVNIPLWRGKYNKQVSMAKLNRDALKERLLAEKNAKSAEVKEAVTKVERFMKLRSLYEDVLLEQVDIAFKSAMVNYSAGRTDFIALLESERSLKKTKIEHIKIVSEYRKAAAELEKSVGGEL